jgi:hypothetical protein
MLIFFWLNGGEGGTGSAGPAARDQFHGIRPLTLAMLRAMERRQARRALAARLREDEEEAVLLMMD